MPDYERLVDVGSAGLVRERDYPILDADFGDGFYAAVTVGDPDGVFRWTLNWTNAHRDFGPQIQAVTKNGSNIGFPESRFAYIGNFVDRQLSNGNTPFWFEDVNSVSGLRTELLVRFITKTFKTQQDRRNPLIYTFSIQFQQIRGAPAQSDPD
jgi:hypothetical protein